MFVNLPGVFLCLAEVYPSEGQVDNEEGLSALQVDGWDGGEGTSWSGSPSGHMMYYLSMAGKRGLLGCPRELMIDTGPSLAPGTLGAYLPHFHSFS